MGNGPSDEDFRRAQAAKQKADDTASAFGPYVQSNRLDSMLLKQTLDKFSPGNDAEDDGIYDQIWMDHEAFYRFTEDYVPLEQRVAYKMELSRRFLRKV